MTESTNPSDILMGATPATAASPEAAPAPDPVPGLAAVSEADFRAQMGNEFTPEQLRGLADGEVKAGRISKIQADEMLKADGVDSAAFAEVEGARPEQYQMPGTGDFTPAQRAADMKLRTWLSTARFPRDVGSSLAAEARKVIDAHGKMDVTQKELYKRDQAFKLQNLWKDKFSERVALARQLLTELDATPQGKGILDFIDQSGLGNSSMIIHLLHGQAERLAARSKAK